MILAIRSGFFFAIALIRSDQNPWYTVAIWSVLTNRLGQFDLIEQLILDNRLGQIGLIERIHFGQSIRSNWPNREGQSGPIFYIKETKENIYRDAPNGATIEIHNRDPQLLNLLIHECGSLIALGRSLLIINRYVTINIRGLLIALRYAIVLVRYLLWIQPTNDRVSTIVDQNKSDRVRVACKLNLTLLVRSFRMKGTS